eukprot:UN2961
MWLAFSCASSYIRCWSSWSIHRSGNTMLRKTVGVLLMPSKKPPSS